MVSKEKKEQVTIGHVGIEVSDLKKSRKFYDVLLKALGAHIVIDMEETVGYENQNFQVWLGKSETPRFKCEAPTGEEFVVSEHLAFLAPDKRTVDSVAKKMKDNGFEALFAPEEHPEFTPGYYAVSFCDSDNHVIEIYTKPEQE
jgi:catechol 2,3-dioxygenase-like lactoylglutathione lyase family enzyme